MLFATVEDFIVVSTILFRLNMSEASRIMSPYLEEEGIADAERAGPPRADKFPAFNAARSIASARRRADNEFAFCSGALLLPGCCFEEIKFQFQFHKNLLLYTSSNNFLSRIKRARDNTFKREKTRGDDDKTATTMIGSKVVARSFFSKGEMRDVGV